MTWPTHGAGPTTPDPGRGDPRGEDPRGEDPEDQDQDQWPDGDERPRRGRHAADPDPLPPLEGPMPGGGPAPAETTLPLALSWPAPPPRTPRFTPSDPAESPGAPAGWRRVGSAGRPAGGPAPGHAPPRVPRPGPPEPGAPRRPGRPERLSPNVRSLASTPLTSQAITGPRSRAGPGDQEPAALAYPSDPARRRRAGGRPVRPRTSPARSVPAWSAPGPAWLSAP